MFIAHVIRQPHCRFFSNHASCVCLLWIETNSNLLFFDSFQQRQPPIIAKWSSTSTLHRTGAKTANGISRPLPTSVGSWCQHLCPRNCDRSTMCAVCQSARMMKFKWVSKLWRWKRRKKKYEHRAVGVNCAKRGCVANYLLSFYQDSRVSSLTIANSNVWINGQFLFLIACFLFICNTSGCAWSLQEQHRWQGYPGLQKEVRRLHRAHPARKDERYQRSSRYPPIQGMCNWFDLFYTYCWSQTHTHIHVFVAETITECLASWPIISNHIRSNISLIPFFHSFQL